MDSPSSSLNSLEVVNKFGFFSPKLVSELIYCYLQRFCTEISGSLEPFGHRTYLTLKDIIHYSDYKQDFETRETGLNSATLYAVEALVYYLSF